MKVYTKLSLILVLITAVFIAGIVALQLYNSRRLTELAALKINEKNTFFDKILKLETSSLETFAYDISRSLQLVRFVRGGSDLAAKQAVLPFLESFNVHAFWIFLPDATLFFKHGGIDSLSEAYLPKGADLLRELAQRPFQSFFIRYPQGYLQLMTAPIQPPQDIARVTEPLGYLLSGRLWDADYLDELSALTESDIRIEALPQGKALRPPEAGSPWDIRFTRALYGFDKHVIAQVVITSKSPQIRDFIEASRVQLLLVLGFSALILLVLFLFIRTTLQRPLMLISSSLTRDDPAPLQPIRSSDTEFGKMAELIASFFRQKGELTREVAERRQTEDALQRFRFMVENAGQEIYLVNPDGSLEYVNRAAAASLGYTAGEMLELGVPGFDPDFGPRFREFFDTLKEVRDLPAVVTTHIARDGRRITKEVKCAYLRIGGREYVCGVGQDITERLRVQEEIEASRDLLEKIFKTSPDIIMMLGPTQDIIAVNDAVEQVLGYAPREIIGRPGSILLPEREEDRAPLLAAMRVLLDTGVIRGVETPWRRKDGSLIHLECSSTRMHDENLEAAGSISILRDVSDKKKMEEQLRQTQKMEAIGTLAGGIAHDFNNILGAIIGYAELAQNTVGAGSAAMQHLDQVLKAADRARELVRQILAFSRKTGSVRQPVPFHDVLHEAVKLLRASIPTTVEIREIITPGNDTVVADPTQLHQIIMNLCTNAAQAMQENGGAGVLELRLFPFELSAEDAGAYGDLQPGPYAQLSVRDTGPGIAPENIDRIFDPFFTTKDVGAGTGMGLAVVHGIVKSHAGAIKAYSEPGQGTVFHVVLPCRQEEAAAETAKEPVPLPRGTERVLLVDDEEMLLSMGKTMLETLGYRVTTARGSAEALALFRRRPEDFDLVITDLTMPAMTGDTLARQCLEIRPGMPIILCSGYSDRITEKKAHRMGIRAYLLKPLSRRLLAEAIRTVLDRPADTTA